VRLRRGVRHGPQPVRRAGGARPPHHRLRQGRPDARDHRHPRHRPLHPARLREPGRARRVPGVQPDDRVHVGRSDRRDHRAELPRRRRDPPPRQPAGRARGALLQRGPQRADRARPRTAPAVRHADHVPVRRDQAVRGAGRPGGHEAQGRLARRPARREAVNAEEGAFARATGRTAEREEGGHDKPRYRRYQFDLIAPHCGRSVLEVGAGLGEFASQFTGLDRLVVTDVDPDAVEVMKDRFAGRGEVEAAQFDLACGTTLDRPVETAIAINVLEHFEDDAAVLTLLARSVVRGGTLVLWVPAYQSLYGDFDRKVGHFRRYTPATLRDAALRAGLEVELSRPVNLLGGIAWWAAVKLGKAGSPKAGAVGLSGGVLVPVPRVLDRVLPIPFGQSILGVFRVPGGWEPAASWTGSEVSCAGRSRASSGATRSGRWWRAWS